MKIYVGYDGREHLAYKVCEQSIRDNSSGEVEIVPLLHKQLRRQGWFTRPWLVNAYDGNSTDTIDGKPFSTEFSHTRFLVPALTGYRGWALFMDSDMVFDSPVSELFDLCDDRYAVMCVKHDYTPAETIKMDGAQQTTYSRKNWSSFTLFNCGHEANKSLTPEMVSVRSGNYLHNFRWLDDSLIGELPKDYNWIENVSPDIKPKLIHYTLGGAWFPEYQYVKYVEVWNKYFRNYCANPHTIENYIVTANYGEK